MGVNKGSYRRSAPSGPWIEEIKSHDTQYSTPEVKLPNPDPGNYKIVQVHEDKGFLLIKLHYPDCNNFEGNKILLFKGVTLIDLVNQKLIDPHFFKDSKYASPVARFIPDDSGWAMALKLIDVLSKE